MYALFLPTNHYCRPDLPLAELIAFSYNCSTCAPPLLRIDSGLDELAQLVDERLARRSRIPVRGYLQMWWCRSDVRGGDGRNF